MHEFEDAKDKVMMGARAAHPGHDEDEKRLTAYHEGGHAIVAFNVRPPDPVHKATIIPRGGRSAWSCSCPSATSSRCPSSR